MALRIHILGASGAGTSTLARNLANRLGTQAFDSDDFYWVPTEPPFVEARPPDERVALMQAVFLPRSDWILAGQFLSWGREIVPRLTHVIFLTVETELRLARLADREKRRYGDQIAPGGPRERHFQDFMDWAAAYDDPCFTGRSRVQQEAWLAGWRCR